MTPYAIGKYRIYIETIPSQHITRPFDTNTKSLHLLRNNYILQQDFNQHNGIFFKPLFTVSKLSSLHDRKLHDTDNKSTILIEYVITFHMTSSLKYTQKDRF